MNDSTVNTNFANSQLFDTSTSTTTANTGTNLLLPVRSSTGMLSEPLHIRSTHELGAHANIGSPRHMVATQEPMTGGRDGGNEIVPGALTAVETLTPVARNLFGSFNENRSSDYQDEVSSHNDNTIGVSIDTSIQGNVLQVNNDASTNTSYINFISSRNNGVYK